MPHQRRQNPIPAPLVSLTRREIDVLTLLAKGLSNKRIADALMLSPCTVKAHLHNAYRKLGVTNRTAAAVKTLRLFYYVGKV